MPRLALLRLSFVVPLTLLVGALFATGAGIGAVLSPLPDSDSHSPRALKATSKAQANAMLQRQAGCFVPNLGQWQHRARFVHRSGPMTLFLEDRGWVLDLVERPAKPKTRPHGPGSFARPLAIPGGGEADQKIRGVALKMTFEGDAHVPEILGEQERPGHHNYFLGNDENRWCTGVPLYGSVRYEGLYPGIDLRLRETNGVPEYDLLLQPGADLSRVTVHVEGGQGLWIASDGSLVIDTPLGPVTQPRPKTWQVDRASTKREVVCNFTLLGTGRFGFTAPGWDRDTRLTIDPALIWSTFLGGSGRDSGNAISVDARGVVTVAGFTESTNYPTTSGAYETTHNSGHADVFVTRLDPRNSGSAQLVYSTFLGGSGFDQASALSVDAGGVVTVAGNTGSGNYPTTSGAYDATHNAAVDIFVSRLDPNRTGAAQLVYSTLLGGNGSEWPTALSVDTGGSATVAGFTRSRNYPTTSRAYDTTFNTLLSRYDSFVTRLDPSKSGSAQLVYSTFLGGGHNDFANALFVDAGGVVTVAGHTRSTNFPTTTRAHCQRSRSAGATSSRCTGVIE